MFLNIKLVVIVVFVNLINNELLLIISLSTRRSFSDFLPLCFKPRGSSLNCPQKLCFPLMGNRGLCKENLTSGVRHKKGPMLIQIANEYVETEHQCMKGLPQGNSFKITSSEKFENVPLQEEKMC